MITLIFDHPIFSVIVLLILTETIVRVAEAFSPSYCLCGEGCNCCVKK
jgi:hypothetical protein